MKWNIKKSDELKEKIAKDEELMRELSNSADEVLKKHGVELKGISYVFEPRVFTMDPDEAPEVMVKSREAMVITIIEDLYKKHLTVEDSIIDVMRITLCIPECGGMDPYTLRVLEKFRISEKKLVADDPVPIKGSKDLMRRIVGNKELLGELSETIFGVLEEHGIKFRENEGCVFTPCVFETPIFAQKVGVAERSEQIRGFGPQIYADPTPEPAARVKIKPFPGIIDTPWRQPTVGIIWSPWWWIGIPAPEMLLALDVMREVEGKYMKK